MILGHSDIFTEDHMIDELISLYFASNTTSALTCTVLLSHFINEHESLKKFRDEMSKKIDDKVAMIEGLQRHGLMHKLDTIIDSQTVFDLEYLAMCF